MRQEQRGRQHTAAGRAGNDGTNDPVPMNPVLPREASRRRRLRRNATCTMDGAGALEAELDRLSFLRIDGLRAAWAQRFGSDAPPIRSGDVLLRLMGWKVQANVFGGLDAKTERKLRDIAEALERDGTYEPKIRHDLSPGVELTREWKGVVHKVIVMADGFQYLGKRYASLSDIARTITGTRWSGPRFFGLEQRAARTVKAKAAP
jgi:Protein of unknown function (DUF2924)